MYCEWDSSGSCSIGDWFPHVLVLAGEFTREFIEEQKFVRMTFPVTHQTTSLLEKRENTAVSR
jgi:hypothetical protein